MRYLCLAYGDEAGWNSLTEPQQQDALAHDAVILDRGGLMSAVRPDVTAVRNWDGNLRITTGSAFAEGLPLAGFSVIEAGSVDEVVALVKDTPCAVACGVIEIRPLLELP